MNRRSYLTAIAAATGGSAVVGSGAFSTVEADRGVSVRVAGDDDALLGIVPGDSELVSVVDGQLEVSLTGSDTAAEGVNLDAVTRIGSLETPSENYAFKLVNRGTQSLMVKMSYYFTDTSWLNAGGGVVGQSFINFQLFDTGDGPTGHSSQNFPIQNGYNRDYPLAHPTGSGFGSNTGGYRFNVGEEYYMVVTIDTTGSKASTDDALSGVAEFVVSEETDGGGYDRRNPPL